MTAEPSPCSINPRHQLTEQERGTCTRCTGTVRADIHAITNAYDELPLILANPIGSNAPADRTRSDESPMPGGDALVLAGPGSSGVGALRRLLKAEARAAADPRYHNAEPPFGADDHGHDPASVAWELGRWEDDWRLIRRESAAEHLYQVQPAAEYLLRNLGWAASRHPDFPDFAHEISTLRLRLELATGTNDTPLRAEAPCFDCGGTLERRYRAPAGRATDTGQGRESWGLEDDWSCALCHRTYTEAAYLLAVRALLEQRAQEATA